MTAAQRHCAEPSDEATHSAAAALHRGLLRFARKTAGSRERHCEERSDEAIHAAAATEMDCFSSLAMTAAARGWRGDSTDLRSS
jgi:hypothetical protein